MNLLEMQHVKKGFGENEVLKDISLSVAEGEVVSIIGPSGSGKSTLLRCATLLEQMDDGSLTYMGEKAAESINGKTVYAKPEQKVTQGESRQGRSILILDWYSRILTCFHIILS